MKTSWKRYLLLELPGAALLWALLAQALAFALSDVQIWRDRSDELALAVLKGPTDYRALLFGDSVTRLATVRFSLGAPGEVGNLSTHKGLGLVGSLFLLQRYLSAHRSPEHVVVAVVPNLYHYDFESELRLARYNLWYTFDRPDERDLLRTYIAGIDSRDWYPAVADVQERIVEPLFSFLLQRNQVPRIEEGALTAAAAAPVEFGGHDQLSDEAFRDKRDVELSPMNAEVLRRICSLSKEHGFRIEIVWPPLPAQLETILTSGGALTELEARIRSNMAGGCNFGGFTDFNKVRTYPNLAFRNDLAHLLGDGWEQRYTADLVKYLNDLRRPAPAIGADPLETVSIDRNLPDRPEATSGAPVQ
jgi:hypothetical protein